MFMGGENIFVSFNYRINCVFFFFFNRLAINVPIFSEFIKICIFVSKNVNIQIIREKTLSYLQMRFYVTAVSQK